MAHGFKHLGMSADSQGWLEGLADEHIGFVNQGGSPENLLDFRFDGFEIHGYPPEWKEKPAERWTSGAGRGATATYLRSFTDAAGFMKRCPDYLPCNDTGFLF
jgi:hypothetical protein